jgi:hypothetical protein
MADITVKPGWTTSEFWVTAITSIIATVNLFWNIGIQNETINTIASLTAMVGSVAFYVMSRAKVKAAIITTATALKAKARV